MTVYKDRKTGRYRYHFMLKGERYTGSGYATKGAAGTAERKKRKDLSKSLTGITFWQLATLYLDYCEEHNRFDWYYQKKKKLSLMAEWHHVPIASFNQLMIEAWLSERLKVSARTANKDFRDIIRPLFRFAVERGIMDKLPWSRIRPYPEREHTRKHLPTREEIARIKLFAPAPWADVMTLLEHLVARSAEILNLTWEDVDLERRVVVLHTYKAAGGNIKRMPKHLNDTAYTVLAGMYKPGARGLIFPNPRTGEAFRDRHWLQKIIRAYNEKHPGDQVQHFSPHALRHLSASRLKDAGVETKRIQAVLGHSQLQTTERYLQLLDDDLMTVMERLEG